MSIVQKTLKRIRLRYRAITQSIAFIPVLIAIGFLLLSFLLIAIDQSDFGIEIKAGLPLISLKDAATARYIASTIAAGIISLLVFSFSMVMILLNQAASKMSNRVLGSMIGNRFQQTVLGFYVGTIVYALFLLSTIRDTDSGIYIPAISIYVLMMLTVVDIFLFIYFLHYVTQSVKYEVIIDRVHDKVVDAMEDLYLGKEQPDECISIPNGIIVNAPQSGYYQGFVKNDLIQICNNHDIVVQILPAIGSYVIQDTPVLIIKAKGAVENSILEQCYLKLDFFDGQPIESNPVYGFHQLVEIAVKAMSPGVNDPATAVISLNSLADLISLRLKYFPVSIFKDDGTIRIITNELSVAEILRLSFLPIWDYAKHDRIVMNGLLAVLYQLETKSKGTSFHLEIDYMIQLVNKSLRKIEENNH